MLATLLRASIAATLALAIAGAAVAAPPPSSSFGKISHVVIVVQENRTTDNLFNGLAGADTVRAGRNSHGRMVPLSPVPLRSNYDLGHGYEAFLAEYAGGKLNGFDHAYLKCKTDCPPQGQAAYAFVPHAGVLPYFEMAHEYAFGDRMFASNRGPSFPAHQYLISGTSTPVVGSPLLVSSNAREPNGSVAGGCDAPAGTKVKLVDRAGKQDRETYPCFERPTLADMLDGKHVSWRYYVAHLGPGLWNGYDAIRHIRASTEYATHVIAPSRQFFRDVATGNLASVTWITPSRQNSDHARGNQGTGPSWVASIVNAIGESPYWDSTAIVVTWDDWGGWYDHVRPSQYGSYELGFRVPLIVISPYAKAAYVSHRQHEFGSILRFVEETYALPSLHTTDMRADDLADCFNFMQNPRPFFPIHAPLSAAYFATHPDTGDPDDE